jgi:hypothetical protein
MARPGMGEAACRGMGKRRGQKQGGRSAGVGRRTGRDRVRELWVGLIVHSFVCVGGGDHVRGAIRWA